MSRKNAFLLHLGASLIIFTVLVLLIIFVWYPEPYYDNEYRMRWIRVIAFVDIVLGPGLTLLVYRPNKPSLKFDMSFILTVQMVALSLGVWNAWSLHPVSTVYYDGRITCLNRADYGTSGADSARAFASITDSVINFLPYPETLDDKTLYIKASGDTGNPVYQLGNRFLPATPELLSKEGQRQRDIMTIVNRSEQNQKEWRAFTATQTEISSHWRYHFLNCYDDEKTVVLDHQANKVIGVLDIQLPPDWVFQ